MPDRDWLVIALGLLIVALALVVAVCSVGPVATADDPPEPEIEEVVPSR
jgi:hypothetical protein